MRSLSASQRGVSAAGSELLGQVAAEVVELASLVVPPLQLRIRRQCVLDGALVDRNAEGAHANHPPAAVADRLGDRLRRAVHGADEQHGDVLVLQPAGYERWIRVGRVVLHRRLPACGSARLRPRGVSLRGQLGDLLVEILALDVVDEAAAGQADPDEDADHEREEDGRQRGDVVAEVEHAEECRGRAQPGPGEAKPRPYSPSAFPRSRTSTSMALRNEGEATIAATTARRPAAQTRTSGQIPIRRLTSRDTPFASTSTSPTFSRATNVDAIPARSRSRNSTRLKWVPTATISSAPLSCASRSAMSSLIPGAETTS